MYGTTSFTICFILVLPDTPRFYVMNGNFEKARQVLRKVHVDPSDEFVNATIDEMIASDSTVPGNGPLQKAWKSIKIIHTTPGNFRALILACGLQGIQQFTGFNSLMYLVQPFLKLLVSITLQLFLLSLLPQISCLQG